MCSAWDAICAFPAGTVLVLPAGWRGDVVNDPDPQSGVYRAIFISFPNELVRRAIRAFPPGHVASQIDLPLDPVLAAAIHHAGEGIASGIAGRPDRASPDGGADGARHARGPALFARKQRLRPCARWYAGSRTAPGRRILSPPSSAPATATLRRRLSQEGSSLRDLMTSERVALCDHTADRRWIVAA